MIVEHPGTACRGGGGADGDPSRGSPLVDSAVVTIEAVNSASGDRRLIRKGDRGEAVRDIQYRLARLLDRDLVADGVFGDATLALLRQFQRERGLAADGIVGPQTWRALTEASYHLGDRLLWHSSTPARGDDVRDLQHQLNRLGFDAGPEDGIFGHRTRSAVEEFQANAGLVVDGNVGSTTVAALRRLHRGHQSGGVAVKVRQREALRQLAGRGIVGARILIDPARGGEEAGRRGVRGTTEAGVTWEIARRLAARLKARGATTTLTRGPATGASPSSRAKLANDLDVDLVVSIALNAHPNPIAQGAASYYFGAPGYVSEPGRRLAEYAQDEMVRAGWTPDCGVHPMTWPILRETRMPTVVVEPGFLTSPEDEKALCEPGRQDHLAAALGHAVQAFLGVRDADPEGVAIERRELSLVQPTS